MTDCQIQTKEYLIDKSKKVAATKAAAFGSEFSLAKYGDRLEITFTGKSHFSSSMGFYGSFDKAFPGIVSKPRNVQNGSVITVPNDLRTINRVIELADNVKKSKADMAPEDYSEATDQELLDYMKKNSEEFIKEADTNIPVDHKVILDDIITNGNTEMIKTLASNMRDLLEEAKDTIDLDDLTVYYVSQEHLETLTEKKDGFKPFGVYDTNTHTIKISEDLSIDQSQKTFLHELAHAITERKMDSDPKIKEAFDKLYQHAKSILGTNPAFSYRLSNVSEFVAGAFNDPGFMRELAKIDSINDTSPSLLTQFLDLVKKILGLKKNTLLDDLFYQVEQTAFSSNKMDTYSGYSLRPNIEQEEVTDKTLVDLWNKQVDSLKNRIKELETVSGGKSREEVRNRINVLNNSLRDLENKIGYDVLYNVANRDLQNARYLLNKQDMTPFDLNEVIRIVEDLEYFDMSLEGAPISNDFKQKKSEIREQIVNVSHTLKSVLADFVEEQAKKLGYDYTYEQLTKAVEDMGIAGKLIYSPEYSHIPLMRVTAAVLNRYQNDVRDKLAEFEEREKAIKQAFKNFDLNRIIENGHLISEYTDDYYDKANDVTTRVKEAHAPIRELQQAGNEVPRTLWSAYYKALNDRFTWYKNNHDYILTEENIERFKKDLAEKELFFTVDGVVDYEALAEWEDEHSPYKNHNGYLGADGKTFVVTATKDPGRFSTWYSYLQATPKGYDNPKYESIKDNEVYKFFRDSYIEAFSKIPHNAFMDVGSFHKLVRSIEFDTTENSFRFRGLWNGLSETAKDWFTVKVDLNTVNGLDNAVTDAFGRPKTTINVPRLENLKEGAYDPFELLKKFYGMAVSYEHKVHAAPIADLMYHTLTNMPAIQKNITGAMITKIIKGNPKVVQKGLINAAQNLRYKIDSVLSEKTRLDEDRVGELTPEERADLEEKTLEWLNTGAKGPAPTVRKVSYVKIADSISDYTRLNLIGLKPFSAAANLIMGVASNYLYAARQKEFDDVHLDKAVKMMFQSMFKFWSKGRVITAEAKKMTLLAHKFGVVTNLYEEQGQLGKSGNLAKAVVNLMYKFQESGEYLIHTQLMSAMMFKQKVTDLKGKEHALWDAYKVTKDSTGNEVLTWDTEKFGEHPEWNSREYLDNSGLNISKLNDFERDLKKVRIDTQGDYQNALLIKSTWYGRMGMVFRTWIPSAIRQRFGDEIDGEFKGRYRSWASYYKSTRPTSNTFMTIPKMAANTFGVVAAKMLNIGPLKYIGGKALSEKAGESYENHLKGLGMSEIDIENMKVNVRELQFITFCLILTAALKALADDDDDPTLTFLANLGERTYQDLSFFVLPSSAFSVMKNPIPPTKTIQDGIDVVNALANYVVNPEGDVYSKGKRKGKSKLLKEINDLTLVGSAVASTQNTMDQVFNTSSYKYAK